MTPEECLASPHHFTYLGVCYPGSNASLTLSNPNNPQPVNFTVYPSTPTSAPELSVHEPSTLALVVCTLLVLAGRWVRRRTA